ncbi:MAG: nuclear transport factor 2 family protein [Candidatus Eisenbacteria bacterium]|nr:nuclear transport factor 2 family protein [Candidatus Eisenbacteria bacterium]
MRKLTAIGMSMLSALLACAPARQSAAPDHAQAVLEAYVQAWNHHDFAALDTLMTADAVHEDLAQGFRGQGPTAVKEFMRGVVAAEPDYVWHLTNSFTSGSRIAAEWTWTSTYSGLSPVGPVTNRRITGRGASVAEMENGKIKRFVDYYDIASFFPPPAKDSTGK